MDSPACRVVMEATRADLDAGGLVHVNMLAGGAAVAATGLTVVLAGHKGIAPEALLDDIERAQQQSGAQPGVTSLMRTLLVNDNMQGAVELMVKLFHEDEERYYDLIVELGEYIADCITMADKLDIATTEETLAELDDMLQTFAGK